MRETFAIRIKSIRWKANNDDRPNEVDELRKGVADFNRWTERDVYWREIGRSNRRMKSIIRKSRVDTRG